MQSPAWVPRLFQSRTHDIASPPWSWRTIWPAPGNTRPSCGRDAASLTCCDALFFSQLANSGELRGEHRQLAFHRGELLLVGGGATRFFGALQRFIGLRFVQIGAADRGVGEHRDEFRLHFEDAARNEDKLLFAATGRRDAHRTGLDAGDELRVARIDTELARLSGQDNELGLAGVDRFFGAYDVDMDGRCRHLFHRLRFLERLFDRSDHVERLLWQRVALAVHDHLEALDGVLERDILALLPGEVLGHREGLRQEALNLARPRHGLLVFRRKLVHAQDRDDVPQLLVPLQGRLDGPRGVVVVLADRVGIHLARGGVERVDGRIDAQRG